MPFLSYAQNGEDVPLWRVFKDQPDGFWVDVGASDPDESITTAFYRRGWAGLNLEPNPVLYAELAAVRPRDHNLQVAASDQSGQLTLYIHPAPGLGGLSTVSAVQAEKNRVYGFAADPVTVPAFTLAELFERYVRRPIDFLKVDVEGHERAVLAGADWQRWRPRIVVVEATEPMSPKPSHAGWEPLVLGAGYQFALFDGLNRFYVRDEDAAALLPTLGYPPCVFDGYLPARHAADIERMARDYADLRRERDEVWWQLHHMRLRAEAAEGEAAQLKAVRSGTPR